MTECAQCGKDWPTHLNAEDCADQDNIEQSSELVVRSTN